MRRRSLAGIAGALALFGLAGPGAQAAGQTFDLVISGGRVMDPETGADHIANVGVKAGRIAAISKAPLSGRRVIEAKGLVVAPGFIDLHSHGHDPFGYDQQAHDGVTTSLELEAGAYPIKPFYAARAGHTRINYGASVGIQGIRTNIKTGIVDDTAQTAPAVIARKAEWAETPFTPAEREKERAKFREEFAAGGLGMGVLYEYLPALGRDELYDLIKDASALRAPVFVHVRAASRADVDNLMAPMQEMVADAASTGASVHICHVGSKSLTAVSPVLAMFDAARKRGVDVTTEVYPYDAGSTVIGSALFNDGWQQAHGGDYKDLEWPLTGERLTAQSFAKYRKEQPTGWVILHVIPEATVTTAVAHPGVMIASDAVPFINGAGHPRGSGAFARVLGVYVRERHALGLMDALSKMTLLPANRLAQISPAMKHKGRVQVGADADLTLFDPATVTDRATYAHPTLTSSGIPYVLVAGTPV
ncbi:MAG: amidohydrolase family protein, partial [Proteobacteria bacterium]|nr:amidohydrolase family protein [Pseudomonadota bacterium]